MGKNKMMLQNRTQRVTPGTMAASISVSKISSVMSVTDITDFFSRKYGSSKKPNITPKTHSYDSQFIAPQYNTFNRSKVEKLCKTSKELRLEMGRTRRAASMIRNELLAASRRRAALIRMQRERK